jgi:hypothetical protein
VRRIISFWRHSPLCSQLPCSHHNYPPGKGATQRGRGQKRTDCAARVNERQLAAPLGCTFAGRASGHQPLSLSSQDLVRENSGKDIWDCLCTHRSTPPAERPAVFGQLHTIAQPARKPHAARAAQSAAPQSDAHSRRRIVLHITGARWGLSACTLRAPLAQLGRREREVVQPRAS